MGDVGEQPMMQPTPPPAPVVTIAARILTPLLKVGPSVGGAPAGVCTHAGGLEHT